jgi:WD40 repeat protein
MFQARRVVGLALVVVFGLAACGPARAQDPKPLNEAELLKLVELQQKVEAMLSRIEKKGVDPAVDDAAVERLKKAGASLAVVTAIRRAREPKRSPAGSFTAVVKSAFPIDHTNTLIRMAISPDGKLVATASSDKTVRIWNAANGQREAVIRLTAGANCVTFSPDGKTLAYSTFDQTVTLRDMATKTEITLPEKHPNYGAWKMVFSPDGKTLVTWGYEDYEPKVWDVAGHKLRHKLSGKFIWDVAFSPDGKTLATVNSGETVQLWDIAPEKVARVSTTLKGHDGKVKSVAFAPDGKTVASGGGQDRSIRVWDLEQGKLRTIFEHQTGETYCLAYAADGKTLFSCSNGKDINLWDLGGGKKLAWLTGVPSWRLMDVTPDLKTLAVYQNDKITVVDLTQFTGAAK